MSSKIFTVICKLNNKPNKLKQKMILRPNVTSYRRFSNKTIILFIALMIILAVYHTIESAKNSPIAKTDKTEYSISEKISLEIENKLPQQIIIRECKAFVVQEKKGSGDWANNSDGLICDCDEIIRIFSKRKSAVDFTAKKPGRYRILVDYKMYRAEAETFDNDRPSYLPELYSNEFNVK